MSQTIHSLVSKLETNKMRGLTTFSAAFLSGKKKKKNQLTIKHVFSLRKTCHSRKKEFQWKAIQLKKKHKNKEHYHLQISLALKLIQKLKLSLPWEVKPVRFLSIAGKIINHP